jgi:hypothetical protein
MKNFKHKDDWVKDIISIRKDKTINPIEPLGDDEEVLGDNISAGKFIKGVYFTREFLDKQSAGKMKEYLELLDFYKNISKS